MQKAKYFTILNIPPCKILPSKNYHMHKQFLDLMKY